jgi:hypothetical protein
MRTQNPHPCKRRKGAAPIENVDLVGMGVWEHSNLFGSIDLNNYDEI